MNGRRALALAAALTAAALTAPPADAATLVAIPASSDNTLIETDGPARSEGSGPFLFAGRTNRSRESRRRAVVAFDLAAHLPPRARIRRAALLLHVDRTGPAPGSVAAHRLLAAWGEGTSASGVGQGAPATPGDATWIHTFFDARFWGTPGGDFVPAASASGTDLGDGFVLVGPTDAIAADVQAWLDHPSEAHGWVLLGDESIRGTVLAFDSREGAEVVFRPLLVVQYTGGGPRPGGPREERFGADDLGDFVRGLVDKAAAPRRREAAVH